MTGRYQGYDPALTLPPGATLRLEWKGEAGHIAVGGQGRHSCGTKDKSISEMGAWGAAYTFQKWMAEKAAPGLMPISVRMNLEQAMDQICRQQICSETCASR